MSALENLNFYASLFGIRKPNSMELLRRVGLADRAGDRVSSFSKGMRQRLMISRAFINKPAVPVSYTHLDVYKRQAVYIIH